MADTAAVPADPEAPRVLELFANAERLEEQGIVTITAQVTDPNGLEDIIGGVLEDDSTGAVYLPFTQISEGTFAAVVTWDEVDAAEPIVFEFSGSRIYRATFVDQAGHEGIATIVLPFYCDPLVDGVSYEHWGVCGDGACRRLGTDLDCEGCGNACDACIDASCLTVEWTECVTGATTADCNESCANAGGQCVEGACGNADYAGGQWYLDPSECAGQADGTPVTCDFPHQGLENYSVQCCCG